jgi:hypothetical protein
VPETKQRAAKDRKQRTLGKEKGRGKHERSFKQSNGGISAL